MTLKNNIFFAITDHGRNKNEIIINVNVTYVIQ
jgi:hypothetical protein